MEFQYFLDQSALSGITVREFYSYNSSSVLDFPNAVSVGIDSSSNDSNFTCFLTLSRSGTPASPQVLLTNYESGANGFTVGINDGNFLFVDIKQNRESFIFDKVNLAKKNSLVIRRANQSFSVLKYDLLSRSIESSQSYNFSPNASGISSRNVSIGSTMYSADLIGYNSGLYSSANIISGKIEQFVYTSGAIEDSYLLDLISGFLPLTRVSSPDTEFVLVDSSIRFPDNVYSDDYSFLTNYFTTDNDTIPSLSTGKFVGYGSGSVGVGAAGMTGYLSFYSGVNACLGTGLAHTDAYIGLGVDPYTTFNDTIRITKNDSRAMVSHNMVFTRTGVNYRVDYDASYEYVDSDVYSFTEDLNYYTDFRMEGIVSDQVSRLALGAGTGVTPTGYNLNGFYDNSEDAFYIPDFDTGAVSHNGIRYNTGYTVSNHYVSINGVTGDSSDYIIGDNHSGVSLLGTGSTYATGLFYSNSSQAFSGVYPTGRMKRTDYKETCSHHLYHAAQVQGSGTTFLFSL